MICLGRHAMSVCADSDSNERSGVTINQKPVTSTANYCNEVAATRFCMGLRFFTCSHIAFPQLMMSDGGVEK